MVWILGGAGFRCMKSYDFYELYMGVILSLCVLRNCVYGCEVSIWRFGGLGSFVIFSSSCDVQSCVGCCCKYVLHATMEGLIVATVA